MAVFLRPALCACVLLLSGPAIAGGKGGYHASPAPHAPAIVEDRKSPRPAPQAAPRPVLSTVIPPPIADRRFARLPVLPLFPAPTIYSFPAAASTVAMEPPRRLRPVEPLSVNVIDPRAIVARAPSGRVVIAGSGWERRASAEVQPYAPPTFHIIGRASQRHMGQPVHLVHGVKPDSRQTLEPRVIWLKETKDGRGPLKPSG